MQAQFGVKKNKIHKSANHAAKKKKKNSPHYEL